MKLIEKINETIKGIYPLTIIKMRFGEKIVILNVDADSEFVAELQLGDNASYNIEDWLSNNVFPCLYGVGESFSEALDDYILREKSQMNYFIDTEFIEKV